MKNLKRILAMALALAIAAVMVLPVYAAEEPDYQYTDPYVIVYEGSDGLDGYQDYCKPYLYASPHISSMSIRNLETGRMESWWCSQQVYNMIDTTRLKQGGEGAYASLEVYCTDACINANGGSSYRRVNLEDSTYFSADTAGKLRAVFMNSFPYIKNMDVIADAVNTYLDDQAAEHVDVAELTAAEVVTATQYTIWAIANGSDVIPQNPYAMTDTDEYTAEALAPDVVYVTDSYMDCTEGARETTANNIRMLHQYFMDLEAMAPQKPVISEAKLEAALTEKTKEADGTYTLTLSYQVHAECSSEDLLTLTATCGSSQKNVSLTEDNLTGTVTLIGVKSLDNVILEINGYQTGGDVYLYDATGDRSNSQSMIGYDSSRLPIHGKVTVESEDHILNIYKSTTEAEGKKPLANIQFEIYQVASMDQIAAGDVILNQTPTAQDVQTYAVAENKVATLKTDAAGFATFNFTENERPDGVYLVKELPNAAVTGIIAPFFVAIPGTSEDGTTTVNTVNVYPKNTTETGPSVSKDVTDIDNDHDTFDVDEIHTWIIRGGVPAGIAEAESYVITDTLDYRLTYQGNIVVSVGAGTDKANAEAVTLIPETHYTVTEAQGSDDKGNTVDTFQVALTSDGMKAVAAAVKPGSQYEIRVYFDAIIDADAQMGIHIPNQAKLDYTNNLGVAYTSLSDLPEVHTGGTGIVKLNSADQEPLSGATFRIARDATEAELADEAIVKEQLTVGDTEHTVVFVDFYPTKDLTGEKTFEATSDDTGKAIFYGLAYGEYYLVETKAPAGFNLLTVPVKVQIDENSHGEDNFITIVNSKFFLPETGGIGTTVFTVVGITVIAAGGILLMTGSRKKRT